MSMQYTHQVLKVAVAQICQSIGFQSIQPTALELMSDILHRYLQEITRLSHNYAELYNRSEPNLDDVALAFKDSNVNLSDLQEYIQFVDPIKCAVEVPKYPLTKESHLNFLKPGSREVLTRPLHIHEHLPPIDPVLEDEMNDGVKPVEMNEFGGMGADEPYLGQDASIELPYENGNKSEITFKRPGEPPSFENASKIPRLMFEDSRPTRELGNSSHTNSGFVMTTLMTTSGFISPARQGKLPDAICPVVQEHKTQATSVQSSLLPISSMDGKFDKKIKKKLHDKEKKKDRDKSSKDLFKPDKTSSSSAKKIEAVAKSDDKFDLDKGTDLKKIDATSSLTDLSKNIDQRAAWQEGVAPKNSIELKVLKKQQRQLQQMKQKSSKQNRLQDDGQQLGKKPKKNKMFLQDKKGHFKATQLGPNPFNVKQTIDAMPSQQFSKQFPEFGTSPDCYNAEKSGGIEKDIKMEHMAHLNVINPAPFSHLASDSLPEKKLNHSLEDFNVLSSPPVSTIIDGKISAAPEKAKLNIFKKIPSKMKEESKTPLEVNPIINLPVGQPSVISRALPITSSNVIVIDDDSSPEFSEVATPTPQPLYTKQEFGTGIAGDFKPQIDVKAKANSSMQGFCAEQDLPLNLTGSGNKPPFAPNFASGSHPSELPSNIQPFFDEAAGKVKSSPKILDSVAAMKKAQRKQKKESKLAAATAAAQQHQQQMMQDYSKSFLPSLPLGALGAMPTFPYQFLPSRPGLIPESPLIPQFDPMRPFGWPVPGLGFPPFPQANPIVNSPRSDAAIPAARGRGRPPLHQNHHSQMMAQNKAGLSARPIGPANADMRNVNKLLGIDSKCNIASLVPDGLKLGDISLTPSAAPMFQQQSQPNLPYYPPPVPKKSKMPKIPKPPKSDNIDRVPGKRGPKPKNKDLKLPPFLSNISGPHSQMQQQPNFQQPTINLDNSKPTPPNIPKLPSATVATALVPNPGETSPTFTTVQKEQAPNVMQNQVNIFNSVAAQSSSSVISIEPINREPKTLQLHESAMDQVSIFKVDKKVYNIESDEGNPDDVHQTSVDNTTVAEKNLLDSLNPPTPHSVDDNSSDISTALVIEERSKKEKRSKDKEHKKERKDKDGKVKKKKDKKDKSKNKSDKKKEREAAGEGFSGGKEAKLSKKEKKEKRKEKERLIAANESSSIHMNSEDTSDDGSQASVPKLTLKFGQAPPSPRSDTSEKKMLEQHREKPAFSSPSDVNRATPEHEFQLARISALVTRPTGKADELSPTQRPKTDQSSTGQSDSSDVTVASKKHDRSGRPSKEGRSGGKKLKHSSPSCSAGPTTAKDAEGNEIWICPACGRVDDGSPMIGCDACDAWYHWLCVGIRVPPEGSWYCRVCIAQKQESFQSGEKKKKRKKKDKKEHQ